MKDPMIAKALERCQELGLDPSVVPNFVPVAREILSEKLVAYEEILSVVRFFVNKFLAAMQGMPILVVITDEQGLVLEIKGDRAIQSVIEELGFKPGFKFVEKTNGNNAVNLSLDYNQPVKLIGDDHYHEFLHSSACYTVPFQYRELGNILGTISIMTSVDMANDLLFTLLTTVVDSIERELLLRRQYKELHVLNKVIIDEVNTGIIITDATGNIMEFNNYAQILTGISKELVVGKSVAELGPIGAAVERIIKDQKPLTDMQMIVEHQTLGKIVGIFDGRPIYDDNGQLLGSFGKFRDITDRVAAEEKERELEAELARLDRLNLVGEMAASIGHEIRNPLTVVRGYLQMYQLKNGSDEYSEQFKTMIEELDRANSIISEFLSLSKNKAVELKPNNLNDIIRTMLPLIQAEACRLGLDITVNLGDVPDIYIDEKEIRQLLLNMVRNSFEAMEASGRITTETYAENGKVVLAVHDTGKGIPPEFMDKLGTPFFTTKDKGTGLGLSVCYRIAGRNGAKIDVKTSHKGTTFMVGFNITQPQHNCPANIT